MKRNRVLFTLTLILTDAAMTLLAFYLAYRLRLLTTGPKIGPFSDYAPVAGLQLISTLVVFFLSKFYHRRHAGSLVDEFYRIFQAVSIATLLTVAFIGFALRDTLSYQRSMMAYAWAASLVTITVGRALCKRWYRWLYRRGRVLDRCLIVGTGEVGRMILQKVLHGPALGYQVVGFIEAARPVSGAWRACVGWGGRFARHDRVARSERGNHRTARVEPSRTGGHHFSV